MPGLPLFPLGAVLFPGARLPLQVFEPRYLALVQDLQALPEPDRIFGVVAIRRGHEVGAGAVRELYGSGTTARLQDVALVTTGPPRIELQTVGERRFTLQGIDEAARTPYLTGVVRWLDDEPATVVARELAAALVAEVSTYRSAVGAPAIAATELVGQDPGATAFTAIGAVQLGLADRQRVLDAADVPTRLRVALALVRRELALVQRLSSVPQLPDPGAVVLN